MKIFAGVDEVGRGFNSPVYAATAILNKSINEIIKDSKTISKNEELLSKYIKKILFRLWEKHQ